MSVAVRDLTPSYAEKAKLEIVEGTFPEIKKMCKPYGFSHGLVGFKPDGSVGVKMEGHNFTKDEIVAKIDELLGL